MIQGMLKKELVKISSDTGEILHGIKKEENGFNGFGEVYFSFINYNAVRAWKMHKKMTLNLIVPVGRILFCSIDLRKKSKTYKLKHKIILSQDPYFRLTVPPKIWFGFKGLGKEKNMLVNVANISHDPKEMLRKDILDFQFNWSKS